MSTTVALTATDPALLPVSILVIGVIQGEEPTLLGDPELPPSTLAALTQQLTPLGVTGAVDESIRVPLDAETDAPTALLIGLGRCGFDPDPESLRRAAGAASRALNGVESAGFLLPAQTNAQLSAVIEGALLGAYSFTKHRGTSPSKTPLAAVTICSPLAGTSEATKATVRAQALATSVHLARDLVNTAPGDLAPADFVTAAQLAAAELPLTIEVLTEVELAAGGYGGILGVGQGSARPPRLLKLEYSPESATKHIAFVGKGITFDTGGISLKPPAGMEAMKCDMAGGAAVLGAVLAAARLGVATKVTAWVPLAENMPSGSAIRPSDVLRMFGGRTVEVPNTDAEGRLVLADALGAASAQFPDVIVDIATLTGAQMLALGLRYSAVMSNDDELRANLVQIADTAGESLWPMPLPVELRASMDSQVADIANIGERMGGMLSAGLFLKEFIGNQADSESQIPWAHLDIAGPAFNTGSPWGYTPKNGTGYGVRILLGLAEHLAE